MSEAPVPVVRLNQADEPPAKLCINCRWCVRRTINANDYFDCDAPQTWKTMTSLVTGRLERKQEYPSCMVQRMPDSTGDYCGREGKFFEPREIQEAAE